jgi:hypothetical protein
MVTDRSRPRLWCNITSYPPLRFGTLQPRVDSAEEVMCGPLLSRADRGDVNALVPDKLILSVPSMTPPQPPRQVRTTRRNYNILIGSGSAGLGVPDHNPRPQ